MNIQTLRNWCILLGMATVMACNPTKKIADEQYLLHKTNIKVKGGKVDTDELEAIVKQKPNRKTLFFFRFHLWMYNMPNPERFERKVVRKERINKRKNEKRIAKGKEPKERARTFGEWQMETMGEPPTVFDQTLTTKSTQQLSLYLKNKGYFNNAVKDTVSYKGRKATVNYTVKTGKPYTIRKIIYSISDTAIRGPIREVVKQTLIRKGNNYDVNLLQQEREDLANRMRDIGYFAFAKEYIRYEVDSTLGSNQVDIVVKVLNPKERVKNVQGKDSLIERRHQLYYIRDVYVNANFIAGKSPDPTKTVKYGGLRFFNGEQLVFRPEVLDNAIFLDPGKLYRQSNEAYTFKRLQALKTFKFVNIRFEPDYSTSGTNELDCYIELTPVAKQEATFESEGTNRAGNLGIAGTVTYRNKNTFRGAEIMEVRLKGGLEAQRLANDVSDDSDEDLINSISPFNTLEFGTEVTLNIPDLLPAAVPKLVTELPTRIFHKDTSTVPKYENPKTTYNLAFNFQNRPDYERTLFNTALGYQWAGRGYNSYLFYPLELSLIRIEKSQAFQDRLDAIGNSVLSNSYNNHLIADSRLSLIRSTQTLNKAKNFSYLRANFETAGNVLRGLFQAVGADRTEDNGYELFNIQFAQYVKVDVDVRKYSITNTNSKTVYRFFGGIGYPYGNLLALPFERSFFGGGANDIRAWQARSLGPGSLADSVNTGIDQVGDITIEFNVEYRFKLTTIIEGAAFLDVGNIWLVREDEARPGANFAIDRFYKELAFGPGLGARLNFSFFIIRLDAGLQAKDPSLPEGERWIFQPKDQTNAMRQEAAVREGDVFQPYRAPMINFNLGIGYPF